MRFIALVLPIMALAGPVHAQDAEAGKQVFTQCMACHNVEDDRNKVGPTLMGVMGRTAGTVEGYRYSTAMVEAGENGLVWDEESMSEFLKNPREVVPGTKMAFPGLKDDEAVANVIAYIAQFSE